MMIFNDLRFNQEKVRVRQKRKKDADQIQVNREFHVKRLARKMKNDNAHRDVRQNRQANSYKYPNFIQIPASFL